MDEINVKRADAAKALDAIVCALRKDSRELDGPVRKALRDIGVNVDDYSECGGEAHSNPHIDNCAHCAPRWGVVGPKIVVR